MAQGPSDTILVAIWITLRIQESKVRNPDPPDRRRFVLCECILVVTVIVLTPLPKKLLFSVYDEHLLFNSYNYEKTFL